MAEVKPKVTLIGKELAKNGLEFIYEGTISECSPCKLNKACNNLKKGRRYRMVGVRPAEHSCVVHLNGTRAVEVIESPIPVLLSADMAIRNTKIQFECSCTKEQCPNYLFCRPDGIIEREKYIVVTVIKTALIRYAKYPGDRNPGGVYGDATGMGYDSRPEENIIAHEMGHLAISIGKTNAQRADMIIVMGKLMPADYATQEEIAVLADKVRNLPPDPNTRTPLTKKEVEIYRNAEEMHNSP